MTSARPCWKFAFGANIIGAAAATGDDATDAGAAIDDAVADDVIVGVVATADATDGHGEDRCCWMRRSVKLAVAATSTARAVYTKGFT